jgi:hypothetical protein
MRSAGKLDGSASADGFSPGAFDMLARFLFPWDKLWLLNNSYVTNLGPV